MTHHVKQQIRGSMIDHPHRWAGAVLLLALAVLAVPAYRWLNAEREQVGSVGRSIDRQGAQTRVWMKDNLVPPVNRLTDAAGGIPTVVAGEFRRQADQLQKNVFTQLDAARMQVLAPDGRWVDLQKSVLARIDDSLGIIKDLRKEDVGPLLAQATTTLKVYNDLPAQLGEQLRPSFLAIEPEITCRKPDGRGGFVGYGGCWHSRVSGLFGEAERVGGVFTQHFPSLVTSWDGIQHDVHGWTEKYVMPHKLTTWGKIKVGLNVGKDAGIAGLRGGVL